MIASPKPTEGITQNFVWLSKTEWEKSIFKKQAQWGIVKCTNVKCIAYNFFIVFINLSFQTEVSEIRC